MESEKSRERYYQDRDIERSHEKFVRRNLELDQEYSADNRQNIGGVNRYFSNVIDRNPQVSNHNGPRERSQGGRSNVEFALDEKQTLPRRNRERETPVVKDEQYVSMNYQNKNYHRNHNDHSKRYDAENIDPNINQIEYYDNNNNTNKPQNSYRLSYNNSHKKYTEREKSPRYEEVNYWKERA